MITEPVFLAHHGRSSGCYCEIPFWAGLHHPPGQDSQIWIWQLQQRERRHAQETGKERRQETGKEAEEVWETTKGCSSWGHWINWDWATPRGSTCPLRTSNYSTSRGRPCSISEPCAHCHQPSRTPAHISCSLSNPKGDCLQSQQQPQQR